MRLAIVSATHVPEREDAIPDPLRDRVAADHVVHAGDVETAATPTGSSTRSTRASGC